MTNNKKANLILNIMLTVMLNFVNFVVGQRIIQCEAIKHNFLAMAMLVIQMMFQ